MAEFKIGDRVNTTMKVDWAPAWQDIEVIGFIETSLQVRRRDGLTGIIGRNYVEHVKKEPVMAKFKIGDRVNAVTQFAWKANWQDVEIVAMPIPNSGTGYLVKRKDGLTGRIAEGELEFARPVDPRGMTPEQLVAEYKHSVAEWHRHFGELLRLKKLLKEQGWNVSYPETPDAYFTKTTSVRIPAA